MRRSDKEKNSLQSFAEFIEPTIMADCQILIDDKVIEAHGAILANSSTFFENAFTGNMAEQDSYSIKITFNPMNLMPDVLRWMYTSTINLKPDNYMPILAICGFYGIENLKTAVVDLLYKYLDDFYKQHKSFSKLYSITDQCYNLDILQSLSYLRDYYIRNFDLISPEDVTQHIDIPFYTSILSSVSLKDSDKVDHIKRFLGDYSLCTEEYELLCSTLQNPLLLSSFKP